LASSVSNKNENKKKQIRIRFKRVIDRLSTFYAKPALCRLQRKVSVR